MTNEPLQRPPGSRSKSDPAKDQHAPEALEHVAKDDPVPNGEDPAPIIELADATPKAKPSIKLTATRLRMDPANEAMGTARKLLTHVPVLFKPERQWWVQVNPDPDFKVQNIGVLEYHRDRRLYVVDPSLSELLKAFYRQYFIFTACSKGKAVFLWLVPMPAEDGSWNAWHSSKYDCVLACARDWSQVQSGPGYYFTNPAEDHQPPPVWADLLYPCTTMDELIGLAFRQTYLQGEDHPVVADLLGRTL